MAQLPPIPNPNPATVGTFDKYWITQLTIIRAERVLVSLAPYDGQGNTLSAPIKRLNKAVADDQSLATLVASAIAYAKTKAGKAIDPKVITINAPAPGQKASVVAVFESNDPQHPDIWQDNDIFTTAESDTDLAQLLGGFVLWVANNAANAV